MEDMNKEYLFLTKVQSIVFSQNIGKEKVARKLRDTMELTLMTFA